MALTENQAVRRAFEIIAEAGRKALDTDLADTDLTPEDHIAIKDSMNLILAQMRLSAIQADPR